MNKEIRKKIFLVSNSMGEKRYEFKMAWGSAPHPDKVWKGGEDAFFVSKNILVVADGVGGWSKLGIDAGIYSRRLISAIKQLLSQKEKESLYIENPQKLAIKAVQNNQEKGSATLSILTIHPFNGVMRSYYVGDSIFVIFKAQRPYFIAQEQQKEFNVPYQVFASSHDAENNQRDEEEEFPICDVEKGNYHEFHFNEISQSIIVLASDGLWDNLEIQKMNKELFSKQSDNLVVKTKNLVKKAKQNAFLEEYESPFYLKAKKQGKMVPKCGKIDDICLILAEVVLN